MGLKSCVFCNEINRQYCDIQNYYKIENNIKLFETRSFEIIPDKFPITDNHIIIIPKNHINTFAEFDKSKDNEIEYILNKLQCVTKSNKFIMFEHGTSKKDEQNTDPIMKSIFHAHLHFIPNIDCNIINIMNFFNQKKIRLKFNNDEYDVCDFVNNYKGNKDLNNFIRNNVVYENKQVKSYFFIKNSDNTQIFLPEQIIQPKLPSQFLREVVSKQTNTIEWNWKNKLSFNAYQQYKKRVIRIINLFKNNFNLYSVNYQER